MNIEEFRNYCLAKKGVTESLPFGPDTLVFKVMNKMFAVCGLERTPTQVNLKCDPDRSEDLRVEHDGLIIPGWHMNKHHWNTVFIEDGLPPKLVTELIDHSYTLIVASLTKKLQAAHAAL